MSTWVLPEFALHQQTHHTIQKKLKTAGRVENAAENKKQTETESEMDIQKEKEKKEHEDAIYHKGYEAGLQKSVALNEVLNKIYELNHYSREQLRNACYQFIELATKDILSLGLQADKAVLFKLVQDAIDLLENDAAIIKISCKPELYDTLLQNEQLKENKHIILEKDANMQELGFKVDAENRQVSFNIDKVLHKFIEEYKLLSKSC